MDFLVVGAGKHAFFDTRFVRSNRVLGVVGLAIARELIRKFPERSTYVVERNNLFGEETRFAHNAWSRLGRIPNYYAVLEIRK